MAAPTSTTRTTPTGFKMPDGFKSTLAFSNNAAIQIWEETLMPPGFDGGGAIPTTTMHNVKFRTFDAKKLITMTTVDMEGLLDPDVWPALQAQCNLNQAMTYHFPDNSKVDFYALVDKAKFSAFKEGEPPKVSLTIEITNWDPVNFVEQGPVFTPASGT